MENFTFKNATEIIFGRNTENLVGKKVREYTDKVLFCYGGGSIKRSGLYERVVNSLRENEIEFIELPGIKPNPRLSLVRDGIRLCRENDIKFVLAVGGGSVVDTAKAISVGVPYKRDVWNFYIGKAIVKESLPVGVIITLPATGSEASNSSVITNEDGWFKKGLNSEYIRPAFSIMNPELTFTLPAYQTACGAADIMAHVMERYFTNVKHVDFTDRLCEAALRTVINNAEIVLKEPENYDARAEIMWTGTIAHNDLLSTGRIGDWGSHKIEHELSGLYDISHGAGLSIIFPAWMKYVYKQDLNRFVQFAVRVWDVDLAYDSYDKIALEGINRMTKFFSKMGLPVTLKEAKIGYDRFEEMADKCTVEDNITVGQFVKLKKQDVMNILELAE
ncbi:MAG: iron-containing alcohol dehydrogenase [Clostridium sp.]|jgi:alcohol dehydrogenase YqhD (iron-dependent ADH family)|uniref:iron-containing alcohol dehydrogenase n=1 Tax=Clostridium sp. TaxID=1506 RepID=UPI0025C302EF|nr:iron-containing alcohol dehydrogenase [Clostridium sp.]MCH3965988.1 iron-containing alcohol dehydrogenase [Clostridium sp.]MCI1715924.1 iron-containing alcohol dehydrogenase [Clostridium sp.]MCI1800404.1 iron-containing alcohol dehydrogenase [Clostridium sp.]MCI1814101.1 iron-containing alcohol dehydrogenase [Clostridium sp.]MCI1870999.1 iron-containing alcohol dehydrogenase [Clostridium sp.]